ncbi:MAG: caspase family protein [Anaerolineales bacterium]|nr:caspase family protein [Anaerolineales bacterium]
MPIVIIDACYSGRAGGVVISSHDAISQIHQGVRSSAASKFALFCSCSEFQTTVDTPRGGVFSGLLFDVISNGIEVSKSTVSLRDIYKPISEMMEAQSYDAVPKLFLGDTLPEFPIAKNVQFSPQSYSFGGHLSCVIKALYNDGKVREMSPSEIQVSCGSGAYGNHQKLSLVPWGLVENVPNSKNRRLTKNGILFATGKLKIPRMIQKDPDTDSWVAASGSAMIDISSV